MLNCGTEHRSRLDMKEGWSLILGKVLSKKPNQIPSPPAGKKTLSYPDYFNRTLSSTLNEIKDRLIEKENEIEEMKEIKRYEGDKKI